MGPVFWVLLETSITKGFKAAVAFDLGVMFADVCFIGICYLGSFQLLEDCLLYTSPSPRDAHESRMPSSA